MPVYIAALKRAPLGIIAQAHHTDLSPGTFLDATGEWCQTEEDALETLNEDVRHKITLARGRIQRLLEKVEREKTLLSHLEGYLLGHEVGEE